MKNRLVFLFIFFSLFLIFHSSKITITAYSGAIGKTLEDKILSFYYEVKVNGNITNTLSKSDITIKLTSPKKSDGNVGETTCRVATVRVTSSGTADTNLNCEISIQDYTGLTTETEIEISSIETNDDFEFEKFDEISNEIVISSPTLSFNKTNGCKRNNYLFIMTATSISPYPLLSSLFTLELKGLGEDHETALCVVPVQGTKLMCYMDVSEKKLKKGQKISFVAQDDIKCDNGQSAKIDASANTLSIDKDCGEEINNDSDWISYNIILFMLLLLLNNF